MQRGTAADALIDAGRDVVAAVNSESDRSATAGAADPTGTLAVGTLLVLAVWAAPILVVALVGYIITAARDPDSPVSGFDDWAAIGAAGVRGTALLVGAALPVVAALVGSGLLDPAAGSGVFGAAPGPVVGVAVGALALATWHAAVSGIAAVTVGREWSLPRGIRFGRSAAGVQLSAALAGLAGGVGAVGFGLTAVPIVGPVLAAAVGAAGVVVAGRLVDRAIAGADQRSDSVGAKMGGDRLAVPTDSTEAIWHGSPGEEADQHSTEEGSGPARPTTTPRRSRRGRP